MFYREQIHRFLIPHSSSYRADSQSKLWALDTTGVSVHFGLENPAKAVKVVGFRHSFLP